MCDDRSIFVTIYDAKLKFIFIFMLLVFSTVLPIGLHGQDIPMVGKWKVDSGWWGQDTMILTKVSSLDTGNGIFMLTNYGTIMHMIEPDMSCKIGLFVIEESLWTFLNEELTIEMKGRKYTFYNYDYKITYRVEKTFDEGLMLIADKVVLREENPDW